VFRVDSNYFQKNYLKGEGVIRKKGSVRLCDLGASIKSFGAYSLNNQVDYLDSGIPFIRGVNMKRGRVNFSDMLYISRKALNVWNDRGCGHRHLELAVSSQLESGHRKD
jgi:hypothetical protein